MSLMLQPNWRVMLGVLSIPLLLYFALTIFYLPESPRWLVSKGRMAEVEKILQRLREREDVAVFGHQWGSLLHSSNTRTSRRRTSSLESWPQLYRSINPYEGEDIFSAS